MNKFKKRKNVNSKNYLEGLNAPSRPGRRVIGDPFKNSKSPKIDGDSQAPIRKIGDFSRPSGYQPARPTISRQLNDPSLTVSEKPSLLNTNLLTGSTTAKPPITPKPKSHNKRRWKHLAAKAMISLIFVILGVGGYLLAKGYIDISKIFGGGNSQIRASLPPSALKIEGDGRINFLLLGIGGQGHDGPDLTDTIMLVSIDPINHQAGLLSIPRDLWVNVAGYGQMKMNALYEASKWKYLGRQSSSNQNHQAVLAGFKAVNDEASIVLGIPIKNDVLVDFQAFQQIVDTLGGVTINVPTTLYDPTIAWENGNDATIANKGLQKFDGAKALLYARSRETSSDFARTQRQRQLLVAIKDKVLSAGTYTNPVKITQLSDEIGNNVQTSLNINDSLTLYKIVGSISNANIKSIGLADPPNNYVQTATLYGQSVVRPTAGYNNYDSINYFVRNALIDSYILKESANISVLNGTTENDISAQKTNILKSYGYKARDDGNAPTQNYSNTQLVDLSGGKDPYTKHYLELRFGVKAKNALPDNSIQPGNANFVIIVGENETNNSAH